MTIPEVTGAILVSFTRKKEGYDVKVWQLKSNRKAFTDSWPRKQQPSFTDAKMFAYIFFGRTKSVNNPTL